MFKRAFEFPDAPGQLGLQFDDPHADLHPRAQFVAIVGLGQIIISAGFHPVYDRARAVLGCQQNNVRRRCGSELAHAAANLEAVNPGHHDIQDCQRRRIRCPHRLPRLVAIERRHDLVAPIPEKGLQNPARDDIVFGDQNSQASLLKRSAARAARAVLNS